MIEIHYGTLQDGQCCMVHVECDQCGLCATVTYLRDGDEEKA